MTIKSSLIARTTVRSYQNAIYLTKSHVVFIFRNNFQQTITVQIREEITLFISVNNHYSIIHDLRKFKQSRRLRKCHKISFIQFYNYKFSCLILLKKITLLAQLLLISSLENQIHFFHLSEYPVHKITFTGNRSNHNGLLPSTIQF